MGRARDANDTHVPGHMRVDPAHGYPTRAPGARARVTGADGAGSASVTRPRYGSMAERTAGVAPDPGAWANTGRETDLALLVLRSRRRDPCAERVAIELDRRRTPAELVAISADQAEALKRVIDAVLDGIGLTTEQRERAVAILVVELRRAAGEEP
jgi:hypothetical protein